MTNREIDHELPSSPYHSHMMQRVFVRVVGFSGAERHALNTAFRLSQDRQSIREWSYEPWVDGHSPTAPRLTLIDGTSPEASEALQEVESLGGIGILWVGSISPAKAWASFQRPLKWPLVLLAMDNYFTPRDELDVDLGGDTWPSVLESTGAHMFPEHDLRRALLAEPDNADRMYWRSKLSSFGITHIDEASNVLEAKDYLAPERQQRMSYDIVVIDLDLTAGDPWSVLALVGNSRLKLITHARMSLANRMSAKVNGAIALGKPLDLTRLNALMQQLI
jgi:CheY-like chemotaxis protein